jgi:preprotein translocase subunit SecD
VLNQFPRWKNLAIIICLLVAFIYALPNVFGDNPAVQISAEKDAKLDDFTVRKMKETLDDAKIPYKAEQSDNAVLFRFKTSPDQLTAQADLQKLLGDNYVVALNIAPATPKWMKDINALPMKLGLDLRGGVHLLFQVDMADVEQRHLDGVVDGLKSHLREKRIRYRAFQVDKKDITIRWATAEDASNAIALLQPIFPELLFTASDPLTTLATLTPVAKKTMIDDAMDQTMLTFRNRVNELGVAEAVVQRQGLDRLVVELPGVQDTAYAKQILGTTASVSFYLVNDAKENDSVDFAGTVTYRDRDNNPFIFDRTVVLSGDNIVGAQSGFDEYGKPAVFIQIGGNVAAFSELTAQSIGRQMGTVFTETRYHDETVNGVTTRVPDTTRLVINVANIQSRLGNRFQVTGIGSAQEARNLALLLRAGALPAPVDIIEERIIGPSMGAENIEKGVVSLVAGMTFVLIFMTLYYNVFGIIANIALLTNLICLVAILSLLGATLTLPSMAAIVLTLGMAVDANVLIFERIREELRRGQTGHGSIHAGFEKAFVTIVDANITTLIAAIALFSIGSGPIKGFAITLMIGLGTSVFTAVTVSRAIINLLFGGKRLTSLPIGISSKR